MGSTWPPSRREIGYVVGNQWPSLKGVNVPHPDMRYDYVVRETHKVSPVVTSEEGCLSNVLPTLKPLPREPQSHQITAVVINDNVDQVGYLLVYSALPDSGGAPPPSPPPPPGIPGCREERNKVPAGNLEAVYQEVTERSRVTRQPVVTPTVFLLSIPHHYSGCSDVSITA